MKPKDQVYIRVIAGTVGVLLAIYCGAVLFYVATSADLGIRCLTTTDHPEASGVQVRQYIYADSPADSDKLPHVFGEPPQPGDSLIRIGDQEIQTFAGYAAAIAELRTAFRRNSNFASRVENTNPLDIDRYASLPAIIDYYAYPTFRPQGSGTGETESQPEQSAFSGRQNMENRQMQRGQYVRVEYLRPGTAEPQRAWLRIQALPVLEVVISIIWCLLEFGIFAVAALSFCHRPSDQAARLFFALCLVTLPAFVGGYHWWVIAASPLLLGPFVVCAVLLPVITLHFYLNYPTRHWLRTRFPYSSLFLLYFLPSLTLLILTFLLTTVFYSQFTQQFIQYQSLLLFWTKMTVDIYIVASAGYFAVSLYCMVDNYRKSNHQAEQKQMQWILVAAILATPLILYAVYLAYADRSGLVLGRGRIPMVVVSLLFLTAYAIGILRHRLMLLDQIISRHTLYLVLSQLVTLGYSLMIAIGSVLAVYRGMSVPEQLFPLAIILALAILAMGWLRDSVQQILDRRFFREKYRLDRAMQQMNLVVAQVADVRSLADHMLRSCREVLQAKFSALYLRDSRSGNFELVCQVGSSSLPTNLPIDQESEQILIQVGSHQRVPGAFKGGAQFLQSKHRELNSQLLHGFEVDGQLTGLVVLGPKDSANPYTAEDTTFVTAIGQMTGVALQCVRVQQNVSRLDELLQEKVRKIEAQERQIAILRNQLAAEQTVQEPATSTENAESFDIGQIRGNSPALTQVLNTARKVARSDTSVLIRGESGTGKELLASALHRNSLRSKGRLVCVNCAALSPALLESELFGHVKGAFTGAYRDAVGRFQMANGGTLFLDEIGDVSLDTQVKLLRVLQERCFEPVGSRETVSVDVRLIAATHQNLEQLMKEGAFREDLYYRLNVITLQLPPLRERKEDIFDLSLEFLKEASRNAGKQIRDIDDLAFRALLNYHWPGNIRELHNAIHRAVVLAESDCVLLENLPLEVQRAKFTDFATPALSKKPAPLALTSPRASGFTAPRSAQKPVTKTPDEFSEQEKTMLTEALQACSGNKAQAARMLGMPRSTFYSKLKKYEQ